MGRWIRIAVLGWIGVLLLVPVVGYALGARPANIENRTLAKAPPLRLSSLLHRSTWHQAADAFSDRVPLRDRAIRWKADAQFDVFGDSPRPDLVLRGKGDWLFLHEEFLTCDQYGPDTLHQVVQAFGLAHAAAVASGRQLYTMLIPAKSTIEADHYRSSHYSFEACPRAREQELERQLAHQPGVIDLWPLFRAAKKKGDLWIPNDSHTDVAGALVIAKALVDAVRPSAWQPGLERSGPPFEATGDLDVLAGITNTATRHHLVIEGKAKRPIEAPIMEFGDSQLQEADPELAPYFPDRTLLGIDDMLFGSVTPEQIRSARTIVVETVQRTAYQRVVTFGYPVRLLDALVPDIHRRLPARYGVADTAAGQPLTLPAGVVNIPVSTAHDDSRVWRLLLFTVQQEGTLINTALLSPALTPRGSPSSARGAIPAGGVVTLAVPPGTPLRDVRLSIDTPAGATLSPLQVAPLAGR